MNCDQEKFFLDKLLKKKEIIKKTASSFLPSEYSVQLRVAQVAILFAELYNKIKFSSLPSNNFIPKIHVSK